MYENWFVNAASTFLLRVFGVLCRVLPRRANLAVGRAIGMTGYCLSGNRRRVALDNLDRSFGDEISRSEKIRYAKGSFTNFGMGLTEFFTFPSLSGTRLNEILDVTGIENLDSALAEGRGALILTLHMGMWELIPAALISRGYDMAIVAKAARTESANRMLTGFRQSVGVSVLYGSGIMRGILRQLSSGGLVGFVLDQNALPEDGIFVPFFGRLACTLDSLAVIAIRSGAPVVPIYSYRHGAGHKVVVNPPVETQKVVNDKEKDVFNRTLAYTQWIEKVVRAHPEQWMWLHERWKTKPPDGGDDLVQSSRFKVQGE